MADVPAIWASGSRKEAMDLLEQVWTSLSAHGRDVLSDALLAGPPAQLLMHLEEDERIPSRDRRVFDRIAVLEGCGGPPLTPPLRAEMDRLRQNYPEWLAPEGEQARFSSWMEVQWGPDSRFSPDDLAAQDDVTLLQTLLSERDEREGMLEAWRQLALANPERALVLLETLGSRPDKGPPDVWERGLWGLRDSANGAGIFGRVLALLAAMPPEPFVQHSFSRAIADMLQAASRTVVGGGDEDTFWAVFDRTLEAASRDPENLARDADEQGQGMRHTNWVSFALNCSMGHLASAFLNALFASRLVVAAGIPANLVDRLNRLMTYQREEHRPARVIAASRISYLFAIDAGWAASLLQQFSWIEEAESIAVWQGYTWLARIDVQLWHALKPAFLQLFTPDRLQKLGIGRKNAAQLLILVGIEFGQDELPRGDARNAIRAMSSGTQAEALGWLVSYLEQRGPTDEDPGAGQWPDQRWQERVAPWIKRVWPPEPAMRSPEVSDQFALAAIATSDAFNDAVADVRPYLKPSSGFQVLAKLDGSPHPDSHPRAVLELLEAAILPDAPRMGDSHLADIVRRVGAAGDGIEAERLYTRWRDIAERNNRSL